MNIVVRDFLLGVFATIIGGGVLAWVGYRFTRKGDKARMRDKEFADAAAVFREAFMDLLFNLIEEEHPVTWLLEFFFTRQRNAMLAFRACLEGETGRRFDEQWEKYQQFYQKHYQADVFARFASAETPYEIELRKELKNHIESLLKFTKR